MLPLSQAAEPGEENPDRGRRDPCNRVRDEEAGGFFPGEIRGWEETLVCWSVCLTGLLRWKNPFYLCFPSQWRKSILNFFFIHNETPFSLLLLWVSPPPALRAWSISAGWDSSKTCRRERTSPPRSTTRGRCTKPGRSASTCGKRSWRWGTRGNEVTTFSLKWSFPAAPWCLVSPPQLPAGVRGGEAVLEDTHLRQLVSLEAAGVSKLFLIITRDEK